jgi:hemolysin activation/secretion protein
MRGARKFLVGVGGRSVLCAAAIGATWCPSSKAQEHDEDALRGRDAIEVGAQCVGEAASACFILLGMTVDGAAAISPNEFESIYEPYLARTVGLSDLAVIAQRITDRYRANGYFLSRAIVPPQDGSGVARIAVIEGRIGEIVIEGDGAAEAAPYFRGLDRQPIASMRDLERRLALAGDAPGLEVQGRMEPIADDLHQHRLVVTASLTRVQARASMDNRGAESAGPVQTFGRIAANSVARSGDELALAFFTTPLDASEFSYVEGNYGITAASGGRTHASVAFSRSRSAPDRGEGVIVRFGYEFPLVRRHDRGLWVGAAFDARHQEYDSSSGGYLDELRVARVALRGFLDDDGRATSALIQASFGLPFLGASGPSQTRRSRADADAAFTSVQLFAAHHSTISEHLSAYAALAGQWSSSPLLSLEQFTVGGLPFGRAYSYGAISGDEGLAAQFELRAGFQPDGDILSYVQGYVYADGARVWNLDENDAYLASAGAGVRLSFGTNFTAGWELARPLTDLPSDEEDNDWRQFFSLSAVANY